MDIPDKLQWPVVFIIALQMIATLVGGLAIIIAGIIQLLDGEFTYLIVGAILIGIVIAEGIMILFWAEMS